VRTNISRYHSSRSNDCSISDCDALEDYNSGPNPHIITNPHWFSDKRLFCDQTLLLFGAMIMVRNVARGSDKAI
jgi:hypothetical protein